MATSNVFRTPLKAKLNRPHDVVFHNGRYVVADTYNNRVVAINPSSQNPENPFWSILCGQQNFLPYGLLALSDIDDHFLITDMGKESEGCVYELKNGKLTQWAKDYTEFTNPTGIAERDGKVYVADWGKNCVHVFDMNGDFTNKIGGDELVSPWFLAFNSKNLLYVADFNGIHVFNQDGKFKERLTFPTAKLTWHCRGIAIDKDDNIFITARSHGSFLCFTTETVTVLDKDHRPAGDVTRGWWTFNYLRGLCVDKKNNKVVVVDGEWHRIQMLSLDELLGKRE
ncbi:RING finger protein nhl-1-like [Lytechinus variegatus]|uniref:RING finger protein nhl-1-like n=1 Tax=Lytechinus variegatus TaxID=7654 RepID=UPI001BB280E2|nr:RING finger protein nhl-1-like [Lytechinus variegatus]